MSCDNTGTPPSQTPTESKQCSSTLPAPKVIATSPAISVSVPFTVSSDSFGGALQKRESVVTIGCGADDGSAATFQPTVDYSELRWKLAGDVVVATGVTFAISPFTSIIDKAIVEQAAGKHSILKSMSLSLGSMLRNPVTFLKSPTFLLMWSVYAATYSTANCLKTGMEFQEKQARRQAASEKEQHHEEPPKSFMKIDAFNTFLCTTAVNSGFSMLRDKAYAQMFGNTNGGAPLKMPWKTYGLWGMRDGVVIASSFVLPDLVGTKLHIQFGVGNNKEDAVKVAQMACPIASQFIAGPAQLLGLDYFNRPNVSIGARGALVLSNFSTVVAARIARIAPTYGIGGIGNTHFRTQWRDYLTQRNTMMKHQLPLLLPQSHVVSTNTVAVGARPTTVRRRGSCL